MEDSIAETYEQLEGLDDNKTQGWGEYPLDTVFVRKDQRTVVDIKNRIDKGRYQLDPEFQRDFVWDIARQSRLIESCLMRIPLPVFYVAEAPDGRIIVVDGLQRLTTFYRYLDDEFSLENLESVDPDRVISGKKFSQLPLHLQERIEDTQLVLYILDSKAPERARLDIFERVNSGVPLTRQQMRNALYSGSATRWLKQASESKEFNKATGGFFDKDTHRKSMRDREVINRFCAFKIMGYKSYKGNMDDFLAKALSKMNNMSDNELLELESSFKFSMNLNHKTFGRHAFRKSFGDGKHSNKTPLNIAFFDVFSSIFAINMDYLKTLEIEDIHNRSMDALWQIKESSSSATNSYQSVYGRFSSLNRYLLKN